MDNNVYIDDGEFLRDIEIVPTKLNLVNSD